MCNTGIECIADDHLTALVHELYGTCPTELEFAEFEQVVRWSIYKLRNSMLSQAPRYSSDPDREEMLRRLSLGCASEDTIRPREKGLAR